MIHLNGHKYNYSYSNRNFNIFRCYKYFYDKTGTRCQSIIQTSKTDIKDYIIKNANHNH